MSHLKWNRETGGKGGEHRDRLKPTYLYLTPRHKRIRGRMKLDAPYVYMRDIKIYCDYTHNGLTYRELAIKYHLNVKTIQPLISKTKGRIERWRNE